MSNGDNYRIEPDSFPTFFSKASNQSGLACDQDKNIVEDSDQSLKERIKSLESQKKRLEIDLQATVLRFQKEKDLLQSKISLLESSERSSKEELQKISQELTKSASIPKDSSEKLLFLESQVEFLTKENKRLAEQYKLDKENWELRLENLKKGGKLESPINPKTSMQLSKAESRIQALTSEVEDLKLRNDQQKINYQQKLDYVQSEVKKLKAEEEKYIKELETKNKENEEIIAQLNKKVKEIEGMMKKNLEKKSAEKKKVELKIPEQKSMEKSLSVSEQLSKSFKNALIQSPVGRRKVPVSNRRSSSSIKDADSEKSIKKKTVSRDSSAEKCHPAPARVHNKVPSYLRKENQSNNIDLLEKEIAVLTGRYKYLLQMSQEASELQSLKTEITKVANEIESKSNQLFSLKKKQKEFLMQQVTH